MLTSSPKISDMTENDFFSLSLAHNDEKVGEKLFFRFQQFVGLMNTLTTEGFQKQDLWCI